MVERNVGNTDRPGRARGRAISELHGKRIGLITNQTGLDRSGRRNMDAMLSCGREDHDAFFTRARHRRLAERENVAQQQGCSNRVAGDQPVSSQTSAGSRPEKMRNLDVLVYDIQDVGARFYTYSCTLLYALEEAAKAHKPFYVLDRPNPITGTHVEGPHARRDLESFVGCYVMPLRHGMTFGELATLANAEQHWGADLHVVKMTNWKRGDWFDSTRCLGQSSPNMRNLNEALLYPGIAMLEAANNYLRGARTDAPFEQIGADWIDGPLAGRF